MGAEPFAPTRVPLDLFRPVRTVLDALCVAPVELAHADAASVMAFRTTIPAGRMRVGSVYDTPALLFHRKGRREVTLADGGRNVGAAACDGRVSLIPAGAEVWPTYLEPCEGLTVALAPGLLADTARAMGVAPGFAVRAGIFDPVLAGLGDAMRAAVGHSRATVDALARAMAVRVLEAYADPTGRPPAWLRRATAHVDTHLSHPLTVDDLAAAAGLSRSHFTRLFKRHVGVPPHVFVVRRRVAAAERLIRAAPDRPLAEIAAETGFCDQSHLTAQFRKHTGRTPAGFRDAAKHESPTG